MSRTPVLQLTKVLRLKWVDRALGKVAQKPVMVSFSALVSDYRYSCKILGSALDELNDSSTGAEQSERLRNLLEKGAPVGKFFCPTYF